jgi:hypothetical protein
MLPLNFDELNIKFEKLWYNKSKEQIRMKLIG